MERKLVIEKRIGVSVKTFRSDNGSKYVLKDLDNYLRAEVILHEYIIPQT